VILLIIALINGLPFDANNKNQAAKEALIRNPFNCPAWYAAEGDPNVLLAKTLNPPCQIPSTFPPNLLGGWVVDPGCNASSQPNTCDLHKGAYGCYRHAFASTGPGAQACYDQLGQWIADPWKGAGTLDAETPLGDLAQQALHGIADVVPYYTCCRGLFSQTQTCNLYYEKRPPGQCENKDAV